MKTLRCLISAILLSTYASTCLAEGLKAGGAVALTVEQKKQAEYRISPDDVISVYVFPSQELSREVTVQPEGTIEMPFIGSVAVSGMTSGEACRRIENLLSKYVTAPQVGITVKKFSVRRVAILGEVRAPGFYDYYENMKMLDLIAQADGFGDYPKLNKAVVYRRNATPNTAVVMNLEPLMAGKMDGNYALMPGDVVFIPRQSVYKSAKWLSDNLVPWMTLLTFGLTIAVFSNR